MIMVIKVLGVYHEAVTFLEHGLFDHKGGYLEQGVLLRFSNASPQVHLSPPESKVINIMEPFKNGSPFLLFSLTMCQFSKSSTKTYS